MKMPAISRYLCILGMKKLSVLTRCPLYSIRFKEVFREFIRKTAGTQGYYPLYPGVHFRACPL